MGKDPAFLFYDGDAAKDVSHLNRLERGCYFDIMQAQRKFGSMPESLIKKILGNDFDECWESIKICLSYEEDMYYIEWLRDSIEKRKKYSESRSNNRKGAKKAEKVDHMNNICKTYDHHMENENENVNESNNEFEEFRKNYPGSKRGSKTEYDNFRKKHRDHNQVGPILLSSLENQIQWRYEMRMAGMFVPEWKNLQTWINQRCWENEKPVIIGNNGPQKGRVQHGYEQGASNKYDGL